MSPVAAAPGPEEADAPPGAEGASVTATPPASAPASAAAEAPPAQGEDTSYLLTQLREGQTFRVRVAAALALGRRRGPRVEGGLIGALRDDHPAVRAAAAGALARFESAAVEQALKRAQADEKDEIVARALERAQRARAARAAPPDVHATAPSPSGGLYLSLSRARAQGALDASLLARADAATRSRAARLGSARIAPLGESSAAAEAVLRREARAGYQLDVTIALEEVSGGTRAIANVLVSTYPGRSIKGMSKGAATATGNPRDPGLQGAAIEHAINSAFASLPRMLEAR